jgi:protein-disulfide isomerase
MRLLLGLALSLVLNTSAWAEDAATPAPSKFSEPNMKPSKESGGRTTAKLILDAPLRTDYVMGKATAPLIMVEYASLSCPHCAHFSTTVLPELQKKYIDTGKMRYILRQFPLNESALKGAMLLDCVGEQNAEKYYVFAKVLFDAQSKWAFDTNFMAGLETIATVGGLTKDQFQNCTGTTEREVKILKQKKQAEDEVRIPHTPYIFVGDEAYEGERNPEAVSKFIDKKIAELATQKPAE